jgi:hypothetical protein
VLHTAEPEVNKWGFPPPPHQGLCISFLQLQIPEQTLAN